jgi:peroxiredoxin
MYRTIIFLLSFFNISQLFAQSVVISGKASDYSGKEISFYTYSDPVVHQKDELGSTRVGADGSFSITISVSQPFEIYTDIEKYTGTLIVEPGKNYSVTLPPYSPRTIDEARSPYFKPALYWLGLVQTPSSDLNFMVRSFITEYNLETVNNNTAIYQNASKSAVNEIIQRLGQKFPDGKSNYFHALKTYTFAELEYIISQQNPGPVIEKYFALKPLEMNNPVYQQCFGSIFTDFLRKEAQDYKNKKITPLVNSANFSSLVSYFESRGYGKDFAQLVVLKGLYDGYYTGGFDKKCILSALNQSQSVISSELLKPVIDRILHKLGSLSVGAKAPSFKLVNRLNQNVTPETYRNRFIYLVFFRSSSRECLTELDSIVPIEKKLRQVLSVVSIATDENFDTAVKLWKDKNYLWELLNGSGNKKLTENYKAEVVPAFYLISPDGTLLLSPAPPPTHEFGALFLKLFRDYNFKQDGRSVKPK